MKPRLRILFSKYLKSVSNETSTICDYTSRLATLSKKLMKRGLLQQGEDIYVIGERLRIDAIWEQINDPNFPWGKSSQRNMVQAFSAYRNFIGCRNLEGVKYDLSTLSMEMTKEPIQCFKVTHDVYKRNPIIALQIKEDAAYICENCHRKKTFSGSDGMRQYMEVHHIIGMGMQHMFKMSLDGYANMTCLCPLCHRMVHHANWKSRESIVRRILKIKRCEKLLAYLHIGEREFWEVLKRGRYARRP